MSEVTVTDYETVEKTATKYKCDHCGVVVEQDSINTVGIYDGVAKSTARLSDDSVDTKDLCDGCNDVKQAMQIQAEKATIKDRWESFGKTATVSLNRVAIVGASVVGAGTVWFAGHTRLSDGSPEGIIVGEFAASLLVVCLFLALYTGAVAMYFE